MGGGECCLVILQGVKAPFSRDFPFLQHLQKQEGAVNPESCCYYCTLCDYSTKVKLNLVQHVRSVKHQQTEGLRKLQLHQQGLAPEEDNLSEIFFVKDCPPNELGEYPAEGCL